jgi:hypothetical protein
MKENISAVFEVKHGKPWLLTFTGMRNELRVIICRCHRVLTATEYTDQYITDPKKSELGKFYFF